MSDDFPSKSAVITGAAGGFGQCFSNELARRGYGLILVDRNAAKLEQVVNELLTQHPRAIRHHVVDLTDPIQVNELAQMLSRDESIDFLVNNAGFAHLRNFIEIETDRHLEMIALHVAAPTRLIRAVLPGMTRRRSGNIINVSSLGAWLPSAGDAQYAATKSYLLVLSQSLQAEFKAANVRVQALCPSFVDTGFHNTVEMNRFPRRSIPKGMWMRADDVVQCSLNALKRNQPVVIPGWRNRLLSVGLRSPWINPVIGLFSRPNRSSDSHSRNHVAGAALPQRAHEQTSK